MAYYKRKESRKIVKSSLDSFSKGMVMPLETSAKLTGLAFTVSLREAVKYYKRHPIRALIGRWKKHTEKYAFFHKNMVLII